jgi:two-component system chemotaxis response regulator CheB
MPLQDIVVIGASAGGVEALTALVAGLPEGFPAAVFVVLHVPPDAPSVLPRILSRAGVLPAAHAIDGEPIRRGRIYVAPPDMHILLKWGAVAVVNGPRENRHRPAIDPLFRSAARVYGSRAVGVLLSGSGDDGVSGLRAIKERGGVAVVQDPLDAQHGEMPRAALEFAPVDHQVAADEMAALLDRLVREPAASPVARVAVQLEKEALTDEVDLKTIEDEDKVGSSSAYSCPDCGGVLWELDQDDFLRFRCRVGHTYSAHALGDEQHEVLEKGLWAAFRALEENAAFARRLSLRARHAGHTGVAERFMARAEEASANAQSIREMILRFHAHDTEPAPL